MTNKEIYSKTLGFSIRRLVFDILAFLVLGVCCTGGFLLMEKFTNKGLIGLVIGLIVGIIIIAIVLRFVSYTFKAGQIAMMTKAVTEGTLSDHVIRDGKAAVKERFATVAIYFGVTRVIKGIFNQLGRLLSGAGRAIGGNTGETVGDVINGVIQVIVAYLCDCCLGWIFYRKDEKAAKATCEGAVLFFKHGKTLAKNLGRVFGMGLASLIVIGGVFFGLFYLIFSSIPATFQILSTEIVNTATDLSGDVPAWAGDPSSLILIGAAVAAVILWSILHNAFVRPFVLVGVLRNYLESGINEIPTSNDFLLLDSKSSKFRELHKQAG